MLLEQTFGQRAKEATAVANPVAGVASTGANVTAVASSWTPSTTSVSVTIATDANTLWDDYGDDDSTPEAQIGMGFSTVESVLDDAAVATQTLGTTLTPRSPGGVRVPLFIPRVTTRWQRDPFSLSMINRTNVEALGARFANDEGESLTRKAIDAQRDAQGRVSLNIHDETEEIAAAQVLFLFEDIEGDLARRLLDTNGVAATVSEANAAQEVAKAFLEGAQVTNETPWRKSHGQLATARLLEWISTQQMSRPVREVSDVTQVRWPDPEDRVEFKPPQDRQLITRSADFVRGYPYFGWTKSVYDVNSFDAYSTEFRLAQLFETASNVKAWIRVDTTVPLRINYLVGAVQREYIPDFIVIDDQGTHWIVEGKADTEMTSTVVLAKADAARAWVTTVNNSSVVTQKWGYILSSEAVVASSTSWQALKAGSQVHS